MLLDSIQSPIVKVAVQSLPNNRCAIVRNDLILRLTCFPSTLEPPVPNGIIDFAETYLDEPSWWTSNVLYLPMELVMARGVLVHPHSLI